MTAPLHPATPSTHHRFHVLDALRGLAAITVLLWHAPQFLPGHITNNNGSLAVDFFFCLSGFVIAFSYEERLRNGMKFVSFAVARLIRLYPVYLLGTLLGLFLVAVVLDSHWNNFGLAFAYLRLLPLQALILPNLSNGGRYILFPLDSPAWSLFYELIANAIYAFAVTRGLAKSWVVGGVALIALLILVRATQDGLPLWKIGWGGSPQSFYMGFARVALSFACGVLTLRFYRKYPLVSSSTSLRFGAAVAVTAALLFVLISPLQAMQGHNVEIALVVFLFPVLTYLGALAHLPASLTGPATILGEISYPLYLLHMPLIQLLESPRFHRYFVPQPWNHFVLAVTATLLCCFSYYVAVRIDAPIRSRLSRRYNAYLTTRLATEPSAVA